MGKQLQIALDAEDFIMLLNGLSDLNFRTWKNRIEIPDPINAPISEFEGSDRLIHITFPDSRISISPNSGFERFESDCIEFIISHFDSEEKEPWVNGQRNWNSELIPCLNYGRVYLDTYRMHYTEELRTMQYYEEDEYHLALLKAKYETICRIIKKKAAAIIKHGRGKGSNVYIWPHTYENMLRRHTTAIHNSTGTYYIFQEQDVQLRM